LNPSCKVFLYLNSCSIGIAWIQNIKMLIVVTMPCENELGPPASRCSQSKNVFLKPECDQQKLLCELFWTNLIQNSVCTCVKFEQFYKVKKLNSSNQIQFKQFEWWNWVKVRKYKKKKWACSLHTTDYNSINAWYGSYLNLAQWKICLLFFAKIDKFATLDCEKLVKTMQKLFYLQLVTYWLVRKKNQKW